MYIFQLWMLENKMEAMFLKKCRSPNEPENKFSVCILDSLFIEILIFKTYKRFIKSV